MIISPYEASAKVVPELDGLDLYAVSEVTVLFTILRRFVTQLNLFADQLYLGSFSEYVETGTARGLAWEKTKDDAVVGAVLGADGFIIQDGDGKTPTASGFSESPVLFLRVLFTKIRRNSEGILKTREGFLNGLRKGAIATATGRWRGAKHLAQPHDGSYILFKDKPLSMTTWAISIVQLEVANSQPGEDEAQK